MAEVKRCAQCGLLKNAEDFRKYTYAREKNTDGRYRLCKQCETTNTTYRRACKRLNELQAAGICNEEVTRLEYMKSRISKLYEMLAARGLRVPTQQAEKPTAERKVLQDVDQLFAMYGNTTEAIACTTSSAASLKVSKAPTLSTTLANNLLEVPDELQAWLEADPQQWRDRELSPEYLQETIYESLKAKYRPQIDVDRSTFMPIYDDTYKDVLNQILRKFDDYEEQYAGEQYAGEEETDESIE